MHVRIESASADARNEFFLYLDDDVFHAAPQHDDACRFDSSLVQGVRRFLHTHAQRSAALSCTDKVVPAQRGFEVMAHTYPGAPAVRCGSRLLSYGELDAQADALALHLQRRGLAPGDCCLLRLAPSLAQVRAMVAVLKAGAACLQLDPALPSRHAATAIAILQPVLLFVHEDDAGEEGMQLVRCDEEPADLPHGWPDEADIGPATLAHAFATVSSRGGIRMSMRTHRALGAAQQAERPPAPADPELADFWRVLSSGKPLTLAAPPCRALL